MKMLPSDGISVDMGIAGTIQDWISSKGLEGFLVADMPDNLLLAGN